MKKLKLITLLLLFASLHVIAQGEANNWYFGKNAGVNFNTGSPVALTNGELDTLEGCATISDSSGQLLFYTDGITVWDKLHNIMQNGTGLFGNPSSTQSAIVIPKPNNPNFYFIFTVDSEGGPNGLNYSEVDISLNNGNGAITAVKNVPLLSPATEKITAIQNANGTDIWVIAHGWNNADFYAYNVTPLGVDTSPVITSVGSVHGGDSLNSIGYMKFSPDGKRLALAKSYNTSFVEIFDFDNATGSFSNPFLLEGIFFLDVGSYGIEFSLDSQVLYVSDISLSLTKTKIHQFNISLTSSTDILNSDVIIYEGNEIIGALQLAIDGKIYSALYERAFLGAIESPNVMGNGANYISNAISLNSRISNYGLPPFIQSFFIVGIKTENNCFGDMTTFSVATNTSVDAISWDFGDGNTSVLENPSHQYLAPGIYTVSVTVVSGTDTKVTTKVVTINDVPVSQAISDFPICDDVSNDGVETFNLSTKDTEAIGGQDTTVYGVAYFNTQQDAQDHSNVLPLNYPSTSNNQEIFAKVYNIQNRDCYAITSFNLIVNVLPLANPIDDQLFCDEVNGDGIEIVDLTQFNSDVLLAQNPSDFNVTYHLSQVNANANVIDISAPITFEVNSMPKTIYVRVENKLNSNCFSTTKFDIQLFTTPFVSPLSDFHLCDDVSNDDVGFFDLSTKNSEALSGQSASVYSVAYYNSLVNAQNHQGELPFNYQNISNSEEVFVKVYNSGNKECFAISSFRLVVDTLPVANTITDKEYCDDVSNNGIEIVDLTQFNSDVLLAQNPSDFNVTYHLSQTNANTNFNDIPDPLNFEINTTTQAIFVRIENSSNGACFDTTLFNIVLLPYFSANQPDNFYLCDDVSNDEKEFFDLTLQDTQILAGQTGTYNITYHHSFNDANSSSSEITGLYENQTNTEEIFYRIENALNPLCYQVSSFHIGVLKKPELEDQEVQNICSNETKKLIADPGYDEYLWSTGEKTQEIVVNSAGTYDVTVTRYYNVVPFSKCSATKSIEVVESDEAVLIDVNTVDWSAGENTITVFVTGIGDYEYSLDGYNYQDSNAFYNLSSKEYTVYIRDKNGCGVITKEVFLLFYPFYFTPNGDSYNDYWQIEFSETEPDMVIYIFDRFGKLLKEITPKSKGWDGNYNGLPMPTSDYWFVVKRPKTGQEYKGHFTLKR